MIETEAQLRRCCAENGEGGIFRLFNIIRKQVEKERLMSQEREGTISAAGTEERWALERETDAPLPGQRGSLPMSPGADMFAVSGIEIQEEVRGQSDHLSPESVEGIATKVPLFSEVGDPF